MKLQFLLGIVFLIGAATQTTLAQSFTPHYNALPGGGNVAWADYDLDGDPDLVTSGVLKNGVGATILYRNDDGQFIDTNLTFEGITGAIRWIDWESDGDMDLFLSSSQSVSLFKNQNGNFSPATSVASGQQLQWVDFGQDGDLDLMGREINSSKFIVRENLGNNSFNWVELMGTPFSINSYAPADYNGDGKTDVLVYETSNKVNLYLNGNGYLTIDAANIFAQVINGSLQSFDFEGDGDVDILIQGQLNSGGAYTNLYYQNNGNIFNLTSQPVFQTGAIALKFLDEDNRLDVVQWKSDSTYFFMNKGEGLYSPEPIKSVLYEFRDVRGFAYSKATNGEEYLAASGSNYSGGWVMHIYRRENDIYKKLYPLPLPPLSTANLVQWMDYDNDGVQDVFVSGMNFISERRAILFKNTGKSLEVGYDFGSGANGGGEWVDFNKDGKIDFVVVEGRLLKLYEGFVGGNVTSTILATNVDEQSMPAVLDFDGDEDLDVFMSGYMQGLYVNNANKLTLDIRFDNLFRELGESDWGDYDHDGDLDLVMFMDGTDKEGIRLYKNMGTSFTEVTTNGFPSWWGGQVKWIDYDQDSNLDLFMLGWNNGYNYVRLYKNVHGTFVAQSAAAFSSLAGIDEYATNLQIVDVNVDGYPDIVVGAKTVSGTPPSKMIIFKNNKGSFEVASGTGIPVWYNAKFGWGDFDVDGDPDLAMFASSGDGRYSQIFINHVIESKPPVIANVTPQNKGTLTESNGYHLSIVFDKAVKKGTGSISFYTKSDPTPVYKLSITDPSVVIKGSEVSITIADAPFISLVEYHVLLSNGAFVDFAGNKHSGISDPAYWNVVVLKKENQEIVFTPIIPVQFGTTLTLNATSSSKLPVRYTSSDESIVSVSGSTAIANRPGEVTLTAFQDGNDGYYPATPVEQLLIVNKASQEIVFNPLSPRQVGDPPVTLEATSTSGLTVEFTSSNPSVASITGNQVEILSSGVAEIFAFQPGDEYYFSAPSKKQILTVETITGIETIESSKLQIYPVPASDFITLSIKDISATSLTGSIINSQGQCVRRFVFNPEAEMVIGIDDLSKGIYVLLIAERKNYVWKKFLKR